MDDEKNVMKVMKTPTVYETVDEVLEANNRWKQEQIVKYRDQLKFLKDSYEKAANSYMKIVNDTNATAEEIRTIDLKFTKLKAKIVKFEKLIADYETKPWQCTIFTHSLMTQLVEKGVWYEHI